MTDASYEAVSQGLANPTALLEYFELGVNIFTLDRLHAKVVVTPDTVFVGSMNASSNSANTLFEAAIHTNKEDMVSSCREFVKNLCNTPLSRHEIVGLQKVFQKAVPGKPRKRGGKPKTSANLWVISTVGANWDQEAFVKTQLAVLTLAKPPARSVQLYLMQMTRFFGILVLPDSGSRSEMLFYASMRNQKTNLPESIRCFSLSTYENTEMGSAH